MISTWNIHRSHVTTHQIPYFFPFVKHNDSARLLDYEALPNSLPNLSLSVIEGGGGRFFPFLRFTLALAMRLRYSGLRPVLEAAPVLLPLTTSQLCMRRGP